MSGFFVEGLLAAIFLGVLGFMFKRLYDKLDTLDTSIKTLGSIIIRLEEHEKYIDKQFDEYDRRILELERKIK